MAGSVAKFNKAQRDLGRALFEAAAASPVETAWQEAFLDARFPGNSSALFAKCRVRLATGNVVSIEAPDGTSTLLRKLWELRGSGPVRDWYGLVLVVVPDGNCRIDYNFDKDCAADPTFYDD